MGAGAAPGTPSAILLLLLTSESGVEPMMVLSRMSIWACTRTWSVTLSVGSSRMRRLAAPNPLVPHPGGAEPLMGAWHPSGTGNGGKPRPGDTVPPGGAGCALLL